MSNQTVYPFGQGGQLPSGYPIADDLKTDSAQEALSARQGKVIGDILYEEVKVFTTDMTVLYNNKQLKASSDQIGKTLDQVTKNSYTGFKNYRIPVKGAETVSYIRYVSNYEYGCLFLDADDKVISGVVVSESGGTARRTISVPTGAVWFIWSYEPEYWTSESLFAGVTYIVTKELDARMTKAESDIEALEDATVKEPTVLVTGKVPELKAGKIDENGDVVVNSAYITTETIFGNFYLGLAEGWRVYEGHFYDRDGHMVAYQNIHPSVGHAGARGAWSDRKFMAMGNAVPEYGYRLTLCKSDQSAIAEGEQPVAKFISMGDSNLKRWIPNDLPNYEIALRRVDQLCNLRFVPLAKVPDGYPDSGTTTNASNTYFFFPGRVAQGVPYSDVANTRTYVPNNVSIRTYMTALKNRRSVIYTEELATNTSKYGRTYTSGNRRAYYGSVCCALTSWVMGKDLMYLADRYGANEVPGLSTVTYNSVNDLRPLDFLWHSGHICILSDIWKDEFGKVRLLAWTEMSTPYPYRTLYTPEQFNLRYTEQNYEVHRWNGWENLTEPEETEYSQYLLGQTRKEPEWSGDIMCFAGDYAAFAEGDTIYLNARRNSVYTGVQLYKNDELLQTIDITGLSADTIVTPNTEDWVAVNLTTLNLTYGKYKARLTDGTNTTDYTYFEVIDITMSAVKSGNNVVVSFASNEGTPVTIEKVKANGFPTSGGYHDITAEERTAGSATLAWTYNSTYKYLLMLVRGDYGIVPKMISFPSS